MTYGTSHLLIGRGYFRGGFRQNERILLCKWGHFMKNKTIGSVFSTQPDKQKRPKCKNAQKCKKLSNIENFFLARFAHSAFYKIHISGAAKRHSPVQYAKYFSLSCHYDTSPLLNLYHINSETSMVIFFLSSSSGSNIFVPQQIL